MPQVDAPTCSTRTTCSPTSRRERRRRRASAACSADDGVAVDRDALRRGTWSSAWSSTRSTTSTSSTTRSPRCDACCDRNGLRIVDVERIPIHGGSLRVFAAPAATAPEPAAAVAALLEEEAGLGSRRSTYFQGFGDKVEALRGSCSRCSTP